MAFVQAAFQFTFSFYYSKQDLGYCILISNILILLFLEFLNGILPQV